MKNKMLLLGIGLAALWWILESAVHVLVFHKGTLIEQVFSLTLHELWMRFMVAGIIIAFGAYAQFDISRRKEAEEALQKAHDGLEQQVAERTEELTGANEELTATQDELQTLNQELEARVEERTKELRDEIAERKRAEDALAKHRDRLEELVSERTGELAEAQRALVTLLEDVNLAKDELEEANTQLKELDRLKSMFIASMSHELRTPLNSIIGFTGIILQGMSGEISGEQRKQLTMVKNSANHLLELINDIIDLSKIEAGKMRPGIEEFNLPDTVQEVADSFAVAAEENGIEISVKMPKRLVVESDERRTRQVIMNFVSNAVKFTDKGGVKIKVAKKGEMAEISVSDAGIGIREEHMDRLFRAFSQVPVENKAKEGTGLGLYLSRKVAALLGGDTWAESEFGKGSVFTFALPLKYRGGVI